MELAVLALILPFFRIDELIKAWLSSKEASCFREAECTGRSSLHTGSSLLPFALEKHSGGVRNRLQNQASATRCTLLFRGPPSALTSLSDDFDKWLQTQASMSFSHVAPLLEARAGRACTWVRVARDRLVDLQSLAETEGPFNHLLAQLAPHLCQVGFLVPCRAFSPTLKATSDTG